MSRFSEDLSKFRAVVFDIDGVLSRQTVALTEEGQLVRTTNVQDGYAMRLAGRAGIILGIITGGHGDEIRNRYEPIGIRYIYERCNRKAEKLMEFCLTAQVEPSEVIYCGDDLIDLPAMRLAGYGVAPRDAAMDVLMEADHICAVDGGCGVAREVLEEMLRARGEWGVVTDLPPFGEKVR